MAKRLVEARLLAGYERRTDATNAHGWVYQTYASHEGAKRPFMREARKYARAFRVRLQWLVNGTGTPRGRDETHPAAQIFDDLPPDRQQIALDMLRALKG